MGKKSGSKSMKRLERPELMGHREEVQQVHHKAQPGPVLDRERLLARRRAPRPPRLVQNQREIDNVLSDGAGPRRRVPRHDASFPVGLFNVIAGPEGGARFRLIPSPDGLVPTKVAKDRRTSSSAG